MKLQIIIFLLIILLNNEVKLQINNNIVAPEIWSTPQEIAVIPKDYSGRTIISVTADGNLLTWDGLYYIERTETGWGEVKNTGLPYPSYMNPIISFDGKRIYLMKYDSGDWNLYYGDWNKENKTWSTLFNCGEGVNSLDDYENHGHQINDTTLLFIRTSVTYISYWDKENNKWGKATNFPKEYYEFLSDFGIASTDNLEKVYHVHQSEIKDNNDMQILNEDLYVTYKDSTTTSGYSWTYRLNISFESDSLLLKGEYKNNDELFPAISADGKKLFFLANYNSDKYRVYESTLLKDKNGNPVSVMEDRKSVPFETFELLSPYPNPFNPELNIAVDIHKPGKGSLVITDILGKIIKTIASKWFNTGKHNYKINTENLSSGIYLITFKKDKIKKTYKTILLK